MTMTTDDNTIVVTFDEAKRWIERAIEDRGAGFVYPGFGNGGYYQHGKEFYVSRLGETEGRRFYADAKGALGSKPAPGCIVGKIFHDNLPRAYEIVCNGEGRSIESLSEDLGENGIGFDAETEMLLREVQGMQDAGQDWGTAYRIALGRVEECYGHALAGAE